MATYTISPPAEMLIFQFLGRAVRVCATPCHSKGCCFVGNIFASGLVTHEGVTQNWWNNLVGILQHVVATHMLLEILLLIQLSWKQVKLQNILRKKNNIFWGQLSVGRIVTLHIHILDKSKFTYSKCSNHQTTSVTNHPGENVANLYIHI